MRAPVLTMRRTLLAICIGTPLAGPFGCAKASTDGEPARGGSAPAGGQGDGTSGSMTVSAGSAGKPDSGGTGGGGGSAGNVSGEAGEGPQGMSGHDSLAKVNEQYNYAPKTRTVTPVAVQSTNGSIDNPKNVLSGLATAIVGNDSAIVLDFGKEVGGLVTLTFDAASDDKQSVGLAFSESSLYIGENSDSSNGGTTDDGAIYAPVTGPSTYTMPAAKLRGGFRYLTVFLKSSGWVHLSHVSLDFAPDPTRAIPNQYPNYFYSNDDLLNRIWYAGAYTFQTNLARVNQGRVWGPAAGTWDNSATIGEAGEVVLSDGAKRDRAVWPGDMGVSLPTGYAALFDTVSGKNSLVTLFNHQQASGELPFVGPPINFGGSDTYHSWTLYGAALYYEYSGDKAFLDGIWAKYEAGIAFITNKVGADGLLDVTGGNDWARDGASGKACSANALLYGVLVQAAHLATVEGDAALSTSYAKAAAALKSQINGQLWDSSIGAYRDKPASTLYPQDGNSLAVWFGVTDAPSKARSISYVLNENWNDKGSRGPEFTLNTGVPRISTFAGSMELMAHFEAGYAERGLEMIRAMWGFMLNSPKGSASTFWEGFNSDGSFAYPGNYDTHGSYTSLAHGWGTGPTSALTFYVLGIHPTADVGQSYDVVPHVGGLTHAEGNLTFGAGKQVFASYDADAACASFSLRVDSTSHAGSLGRIGVPRWGADHVIRVDETKAWNGSKFLGAEGIERVETDADYIYFVGVAPGVHTFSFSDGTACPAAAERWTFCAEEAGACKVTGTKRVRFGAHGQYEYGIVKGEVPCTSAQFGDPAVGVHKGCEMSDDLYTHCADEGGTCSVIGKQEVRFGANGQWLTRTVMGSVPCAAGTFGDPLPNVKKRCEARDIP